MRKNIDFASEARKIYVFSIFPLPWERGMGHQNIDFKKAVGTDNRNSDFGKPWFSLNRCSNEANREVARIIEGDLPAL
jgi:hypothetical protein